MQTSSPRVGENSGNPRSNGTETSDWTPHSTGLAQLLLALREAPLPVQQISRDMDFEQAAASGAESADNRQKQKKKRSQPKPEQPVGCNCRKSRCLKLYCQCFAQQISCNPACRCMQCVNTGTNDALVQAAVRAILERNPNAFESKFKPGKDDDGKVKLVHKLGCRCRRSLCLKKYCECFHGGVYCSDVCACTLCQNVPNPPQDQQKLSLDVSDRDSSGGHSTASDSEDNTHIHGSSLEQPVIRSPVKRRLDQDALRLQDASQPTKVLQRSATVVTQGSDTAGEQELTGNESSLSYLLGISQPVSTQPQQLEKKRSRESAFTSVTSSSDKPAKHMAVLTGIDSLPGVTYKLGSFADRSASPSSMQCISALTMLCGAKVTPDMTMSKVIEAEPHDDDQKDQDFGTSPVTRIYKVEELKEASIAHAVKPVKYASPSDSSVQSASGSDYLSNSPNYFDREPGCIADRHPRTSTPIMHA